MTEITDERRLDIAQRIALEAIQCGIDDLEEIYKMEINQPGTIERAFTIADELGIKLNFGVFVVAVKDMALQEIRSVLTDKDARSFEEMVLYNEYISWGPVEAYGSYEGTRDEQLANHKRQDLFAQYITGQITRTQFEERYKMMIANEREKNDIYMLGLEVAKLEGKYVAIHNNKVIGVGDTSLKALNQAKKKYPHVNPIIMLVSSSEIQ